MAQNVDAQKMSGKSGRGGRDAKIFAVLSGAIIAAPARGAGGIVPHQPVETVMTPSGPRDRRMVKPDEYAGRVADAFDRADRRRSVPLFRPDQVAAGRAYVAVAERVGSLGYPADLLAQSSGRAGGGAGGGAAEWQMDLVRQWAQVRSALGGGQKYLDQFLLGGLSISALADRKYGGKTKANCNKVASDLAGLLDIAGQWL